MFKRMLFLAILSSVVLPLAAQPLAEHVPGDAIAYVGWRGADDPGAGYDGSNLQALCDASDLPGAITQTLGLIEALNPGDEQAARALHLIRTIGTASWQRPTAAYVQPVDDAEMPVRLVFLWQAEGGQADALTATLADVAEQDRSGGITHGRGDGLVWLTLAAMGQGLEEIAVEPADSLARAPKFKEVLTQADPGGMLVVYADGKGLLSLIDGTVEQEANPREAEQWMKVRSALGLEGLNALVWTGGFDGKDWRTDLFIDAPAPRTGVLTLLDAEPITDAELVNVPAEATWLCALRFDLGALLDNVRKVIVEIDPEAAQQFEEALARGSQMTGIDLEADLIRSLGSAWLAYTDPGATGSGMLGVCLVNPLKDAEKAELALTGLQALANAMMSQAGASGGGPPVRVRFHTSTRDGMTLRTLGIPFIAPTWSVHEGKLYVGLFPQTVLAAGARAAGGSSGGDSILDNDAYLAMRDRLGGGEASAVVFADLPRTAEGSYQNLVMLSQMGTGMLAMFGADPVPTLLPPFAKIQPLLSPAGQVAWSDDAGYHCRSVSPFPGSAMLGPQYGTNMTVAGPIMVGTLLPALGQARRTARQAVSMSNIRQVLVSLYTYAVDHDDTFPEDIAVPLLMGYLPHPAVFVSPASGKQAPPGFAQLADADKAQWVRRNSSYVLIPQPKLDLIENAWQRIVLFELPDDSSDRQRLSVGFADGHAEAMSEMTLRQQVLAQTGKAMEEWVERQQTYQPPAE